MALTGAGGSEATGQLGAGPLETPASAADAPDKAAYDDLPDGVLVVDSDGRVLQANSAAVRLTGLGIDTLVGRSVADVLPLTDVSLGGWWGCILAAAALPGVSRQPERKLTLTSTAARAGLAERDLLVTARFVRDEGRLVRLVVCLRDTNARERIERSAADLISTVAHELRSPLTSVKGFTATLLAKWDRFNDEQKKLMLTTVNADADRVTRLLSELLDVSRIDAGRLEMRRQVVDVTAVVRKAFEGRIASGEADDRFTLNVTGELPEMWLDPDKCDQVFGNLVENALRHGSGRVTVDVVGRPDGAEVTVRDEGEGISPEVAARVFTKFWRGQPRRGGTGLGLYIVKGLIEAHGGSITAGTGPGGGAEFRFWLPAGTPSFAQ